MYFITIARHDFDFFRMASNRKKCLENLAEK